MKALFIADWMDVAFLHFRVDAVALAAQVPPSLTLDLHDGQAYVSLVAFTQRRLRPVSNWAIGGKRVGRLAAHVAANAAEWLSAPLASHEFLNVRTYVRGGEGRGADLRDGRGADLGDGRDDGRGDTRGIFFLAEWIPNRLAAFLGPRMYGLPYRLGRLNYTRNHRTVRANGKTLSFDITDDLSGETPPPAISEPGGLDEFLLERYTAYTHRDGITRRFDVQHNPWLQSRVEANLTATSLLSLSGSWWHGHEFRSENYTAAEFSHANYSPGTQDVTISAPRRVLTGRAAACMAER